MADSDNHITADPYDFHRFLISQMRMYAQALAEIQAGHKTSHWMWFIFPQYVGLGQSPISEHYAIKSVAEAKAYLEHPELGPRLLECCEAILKVEGRTAREILESPDDLKLRSCATLFASVSAPGSVFERVLEKYYGGQPDKLTLELMDASNGEG